MGPIPLVRAAVLRPVVAFLVRLGAPAERHLEAARLPPRVLGDAEALLPFPAVCRFLEAAARGEGIEQLGLLAGREATVGALGTFGRLVLDARTFEDALHTASRLMWAYSSGERLWVARRHGEVQLCHEFVAGLDAAYRHLVPYSLMLQINFLRLGTAPDWQPRIHLEDGQPCGIEELELLSNRRAFQRGATAVTVPEALLRQPLPRATTRPRLVVDRAWYASAPAPDFPGSVLQVVGTLLRAGYPDIHLVGEALGMNARSLQRRLADSGASFVHLVKRARLDAATRLLEEPSIKLVDIALELGYSDHAHFTRAFRRWTGVPPRVFRRQRQGAETDERAVGDRRARA